MKYQINKLIRIFNLYFSLINKNQKFLLTLTIVFAVSSSLLEVVCFDLFSKASYLFNDSFNPENLNLLIKFSLVFIFTNIVRLAYLFFASNFAYNLAALIDNKAFNLLNTLYIQFNNEKKEFVEKYLTTSSMIIAPNIFLPLFLLLNSILSTLAIVGYLFYFFGVQIIGIFLIILLIYIFYFKVFKTFFNSTNGISRNLRKRNSTILDIRFNFIELFTLNLSENLYIKFKNSQKSLRKTEALINFNSFSPRYFIEICVLIIIMILFAFSRDIDYSTLILMLSTYGYAFLRLLPFIQTAYGSLNTFLSFIEIVKDSESVLSIKTDENLVFYANILENKNNDFLAEFKEFSFVLKDKNQFQPLNLTLKKKTNYSITGPSGIGKSSILNYLSLGRSLIPYRGNLNLFYEPIYLNYKFSKEINSVDVITMGQSSRFRSGYLYNVLCEYLIKLGILDKYSLVRDSSIKALVEECLYILNIDFIKNKNSNPYIDFSKLSGGQTQRICIARSLISALFLDPKILIWDEPFSSLDKLLALKIFNNIMKSRYDFSLIMVSHLPLESEFDNFYEIKLIK